MTKSTGRSQEHKARYPYIEEEVFYKNVEEDIILAGTLTLPASSKRPFPAVLLISGMGPNKRDYEMLGHKLFLVLADYLTRQGIAVLRVDKRGIGKSTGTYNSTITSKDLSRDVIAGIEYLKTRCEIDPTKIGLIGHSEGGMIATMVAKESKDVSFIVLMAGVVATHIDDVVKQVGLQLQADGASKELIAIDREVRKKLLTIIKKEPEPSKTAALLHVTIKNYLSTLPDKCKTESQKLHFAITDANQNDVIAMLNSPWYRYFLAYNSLNSLKEITIPVLAIYGSLDFITSPEIAIPLITKALKEANNTTSKITELPKLNHWLQPCKTGAMVEYGMSEETIAPIALDTITKWIQGKTKK